MSVRLFVKQKALWLCQHPALCLTGLFLLSVAAHLLLNSYDKFLTIYVDELYYVSSARNLAAGRGISLLNSPLDFPKVLYSICIMPAMLFSSTVTQLRAVTVINALVMSSALFPAYLLGKRMFNDSGRGILAAILTVTLPIMTNVGYFMSEVLIYPMALWTVYAVYCSFHAGTTRRRLFMGAAVGVFCYLSYMTKEIALYFILSYICTAGVTALINRSLKREIVPIAVSGAVFLVIHIVLKLTLYADISNFYTPEVGSMLPLGKLSSLIFALTSNTVFFITAFMVVPIVITAATQTRKEPGELRFAVFLMTCMAVAIGVISLMISINEDYGELSIRIHTRYVEPLMIPLFLTALKGIERIRSDEVNQALSKKISFYFLFFFSLLLFVVREPGKGALVDNNTLSWFNYVFQSLDESPVASVCMKALIVIVSVLLVVFIYRKSKTVTAVLLSAVFVINAADLTIEHSMAADFYQNNDKVSSLDLNKQEIDEANQFLSSLEGSILRISGNARQDARIADAYINVPMYATTYECMNDSDQLEDHTISLAEEELVAEYIEQPYAGISQIDYILSTESLSAKADDVYLDSRYVELIPEFRLSGFLLYRNLDPGSVHIVRLFPEWKGESVTLIPGSKALASDCAVEGSEFVKTEDDQWLFELFECETCDGVYRLTIDMELPEGTPEDEPVCMLRYSSGSMVGDYDVYSDGSVIIDTHFAGRSSLYCADAPVGTRLKSVTIERVGDL